MKSSQDLRNINALRFLGIDAVSKANSGHPGAILGASPIIYTLFKNHLNYSVKNPTWINRDRFILSNGHASMLLYGIHHLIGNPDLSIDEIKRFRQLDSKTPGHPERGITQGVEFTTGPLGQGLAGGVGIATNQVLLQAEYGHISDNLINYHTYVMVGDGCLQEGISEEAIAFAGCHKLKNLIVLFDSNDVQLDTMCDQVTCVDHKKRFESHCWNYILVKDGNDIKAIDFAIKKAKKSTKPTLIEIKNIIGYGSPVANSPKAHGAPLSAEALAKTRETLDWKYQPFEIPVDVYTSFKKITRSKELFCKKWTEKFDELCKSHMELKNLCSFPEIEKIDMKDLVKNINPNKKPMATRQCIGEVLKELERIYPKHIIAGSADLSGSTFVEGHKGILGQDKNPNGIKYGVREFGMGAISAGIALQKHYWPMCATFLSFADYMKASIRLAALMNAHVLYVFTHDSIFAGEDGPTHQPIEQLTMLRSIPNTTLFRPCDVFETIGAFEHARVNRLSPTIIIGSRQNLAYQENSRVEGTLIGGYILEKEINPHLLTIAASGSEVELAQQLKKRFNVVSENIRIVSIPSINLFLRNDENTIRSVLGNKKTIFLEAADCSHYYRLKKEQDIVVELTEFGHSAPGSDVAKKMNFDIESIYRRVSQHFGK